MFVRELCSRTIGDKLVGKSPLRFLDRRTFLCRVGFVRKVCRFRFSTTDENRFAWKRFRRTSSRRFSSEKRVFELVFRATTDFLRRNRSNREQNLFSIRSSNFRTKSKRFDFAKFSTKFDFLPISIRQKSLSNEKNKEKLFFLSFWMSNFRFHFKKTFNNRPVSRVIDGDRFIVKIIETDNFDQILSNIFARTIIQNPQTHSITDVRWSRKQSSARLHFLSNHRIFTSNKLSRFENRPSLQVDCHQNN